MKAIRSLGWLFFIFFILSILLFLLKTFYNIGIPFKQSAVILSGSFVISIIVMILFIWGYKQDEKTRLSYTLAAISLKFLLYFVLIITVYFLSKNRTLEFILTFFVIYLSFTSYIMFSFLKLLKTKKIDK